MRVLNINTMCLHVRILFTLFKGHRFATQNTFLSGFVPSGRRGWVVGIHVPCDGIMAVERCVGCFVILACSRDVWEKFSSGTSLNKQCLSAYSK